MKRRSIAASVCIAFGSISLAVFSDSLLVPVLAFALGELLFAVYMYTTVFQWESPELEDKQ